MNESKIERHREEERVCARERERERERERPGRRRLRRKNMIMGAVRWSRGAKCDKAPGLNNSLVRLIKFPW